MLLIYNTLTKQKEPLNLIEPGHVKIYVCGMTVYDYCHIGHARTTMVVFDVVVRYLRSLGYRVTYVRNITDIDDKIIQRAQENNEDYHQLTARFIEAMHQDAKALNVLPPDHQPRATEYIDKMIDLIQQLIDKGFAYVASNGDVYYAVHKFSSYGELAHQDRDNLRAGARVSIVNAKTDPLDFALWKIAKPGEPAWDSPWGKGRPGWHIECSAMSLDCLGEHFDIHGGGFDLIFPHHQNEIAQSEGATGKKFVNTWMHVGFVTINKEKMSKSLGNFFTIRDVLKNYPPEVIRFFMLTSHYRSQLNYSTDLLDQSHTALERLYLSLRGTSQSDETQQSRNENIFVERFHQAMEDDFNTPDALAVLFDIAREINKIKNTDVARSALLRQTLKQLGDVLGILQQAPENFLKQSESIIDAQQIEQLINERNLARQQKDWAKADTIRKQLQEMRIIIEDNADETTWRSV
jgi:cysteinyl-tRNA synthetase